MIVRKKVGTRVAAPADVVFQELERAKIDGSISLETIVANAKPKNAPLHGEFTWANGEAAEKWRLYEARKVVQSIEVIHETGRPTRAFESTTITVATADGKEPETRRVFQSVADIMGDPLARDELLTQAIRDALAWRRRYSGLQELAQAFAALDRIVLERKVG